MFRRWSKFWTEQAAIPIVLCFDSHYAPFAAVTTLSIGENAKIPSQIFWITFEEDIAAAEKAKDSLRPHGVEVKIVPVADGLFSDFRTKGYLTRGTYLRLLIPDLISRKKALYLDCDTIVESSLAPLAKLRLGKSLFAGVLDPPGRHLSKIDLAQRDPYVNAGVLLMNLEELRRADLLNSIRELAQMEGERATFLDQCLLNKFAAGRKLVIDARWNRLLTTGKDHNDKFSHVKSDTAIFHFLTRYKPWHDYGKSTIADHWWSYADRLSLPELQNYKPQADRIKVNC